MSLKQSKQIDYKFIEIVQTIFLMFNNLLLS